MRLAIIKRPLQCVRFQVDSDDNAHLFGCSIKICSLDTKVLFQENCNGVLRVVYFETDLKCWKNTRVVWSLEIFFLIEMIMETIKICINLR